MSSSNIKNHDEISSPRRNSTPMERLTRWTFIVILVTSLHYFQTSEACSCNKQHPQTDFCYSEFTVNLTVTKSTLQDDRVIYDVVVHRIFKATDDARIALGRTAVRLWSPSSESHCGRLDLTPGKTWIVGGTMLLSEPYITACNFAQLSFEVPERRREGFDKLFSRGCACPIKYIRAHPEEILQSQGRNKNCLWENYDGRRDCQERNGICQLTSAGCSWEPSAAYEECMAQYPRLGMEINP